MKNNFLFIFMITLFNSCLLNTAPPISGVNRDQAAIANTADTVSPGFGRLIPMNPIAASGNSALSPAIDISAYLNPTPEFITNSRQLLGDCLTGITNISSCFSARKDFAQIDPLYSDTNRWAYPVATPEFLQVNVYGHLNKIISSFLADLTKTQQELPFALNPLVCGGYWMRELDNNSATISFLPKELKAYVDVIPLDDQALGTTTWINAQFHPANNHLYFGKYKMNGSEIFFAHDPSVVYHEMGHAFQHIMFNLNNLQNLTPSCNTRVITNNNEANIMASVGTLAYDEGRAIGEGLSDYFSFYKTRRTHFSEWAAGLLGGSRPISETDPLHAAGVSADDFSRLSYPDYINYDPNDLNSVDDSIHASGMMISHFLTTLTGKVQSTCNVTQDSAVSSIMEILIKTLSDLGTFDPKISQTSMAQEMVEINLNLNFRNFAQTFSTYFIQLVSNSLINCPGGVFTSNNYERILDQYGLLLFSKYNNNTYSVNPQNILKSITIPKSSLIFDPTIAAPKYYIIDNRATIVDAITKLDTNVKETLSHRLVDPVFGDSEKAPYNNGNSIASPGEMIAVGLNLYNNSNATMAGLHILANDWDHVVKNGINFDYCSIFEDNWPGTGVGGTTSSLCNQTQNANLSYNTTDTTQSNFVFPVCSVQINDINGTKWAAQGKLVDLMGVNESTCLEAYNRDECFVRFVKGLDHAFISKVQAQKNWAESNLDPNGVPILGFHNLLFMEINTNVPVGTKFSCRLRANFTNCSDCFEDPITKVNHAPSKFTGHEPFRIFHFEFIVGN